MRTYYADYLIDNAEPNLIHDQFAQKHKIPQHGGKTIQFRKYDPLPKLTEALSEGVTPSGQALNMGVIEATVRQYGGYVEFSDLLLLSAVDNNLVMATKLLGSQAGRTLDTITREVLCGGTNVQYGEDAVAARYLLTGGKAAGNHYMSVDCIKRAVRFLKSQNAEKINGAYACIIHPDCAYDLTNDPNWKYPHQYADTKALYEGEIGMIEGVRFVESTEAKVFHASDLAPTSRAVTCLRYDESSAGMLTVTHGVKSDYVAFTYTSVDGGVPVTPDIVGRSVLVHDVSEDSWQYAQIVGMGETADTTYIFMDRRLLEGGAGENSLPFVENEPDMFYPGEAGMGGRDVYATLVMGDNAYGTTELSGGGLQHIVKQLGSAGTADPLNQRATVGWKATKAATRLVEAFMVRIETASTFGNGEA
jgi:N4-gp56 family major capsid protein